MIDPVVYTTADLQRLFKASTRTIQRWSKQGRLPKPIMPGRWLRVDVDAVISPPHSTIERHIRQSSDTAED